MSQWIQFRYALDDRSGEVHLVTVSDGIVRSAARCNVDDMTGQLRLISNEEAWAVRRERWHFDCTFPEDEEATEEGGWHMLDMSAPADDGINVRTVYRTLRGVGEERQ